MKEKISLREALDRTGMLQKDIMKELSLTPTYYTRFTKLKSITRPQALMIEKLTKMKIKDIDIIVK